MNKSNKEQSAPKGLRDCKSRQKPQEGPLGKSGGLYVVGVTKVGYVWAPSELEASEYADEILSTESEKTAQVCPVLSSNLNPLNWDLDCLIYHDGKEDDDFTLRKAVEMMKEGERPSSGASDQPGACGMNYAYDPEHPIQLPNDAFHWLHVNKSAAAQIGADMQLEKCCEWLEKECLWPAKSSRLYAAMRPRPLSKREKALKDINALLASESKLLPLTKAVLVAAREALMEGQGDA